MSEPFVYDPRCILCKSPFGAVSCSQLVTYHLRPLCSENFDHCAIVLDFEFAGQRQELELAAQGQEGDRFGFSLTIPAPSQPELLWYHFRFWRDDGSGCILDKSGYRSDGGLSPWQLTVYAEQITPQWFGQGTTYQIFPDRYCRLNTPSPQGLVGNRWVAMKL